MQRWSFQIPNPPLVKQAIFEATGEKKTPIIHCKFAKEAPQTPHPPYLGEQAGELQGYRKL